MKEYNPHSEELHALLDTAYTNQRVLSRANYWHSKKIIQYINRLTCASAQKYVQDFGLLNAAAYYVLKEKLKQSSRASLPLALSIGCGSAEKEMQLLQENVVGHFLCFELSAKRIELAKQQAQSLGLTHRITFHHQDFFSSQYNKEESYDLVFWDGSLHHMQDTRQAVETSYNILKEQGIFYCNDYIGPSYYQWSDAELSIVNSVLATFDARVFENPKGGNFARKVWRPSIDQIKAADPTEAVDSAHIKPAILARFKDVYHKDLGGLLYLLCLNNLLVNIEEEDPLLEHVLKLDEHTISLGLSQFAFFLAVK